MVWYVVLVVSGVVMFVAEAGVRRRRRMPIDLREAGLSVRVGVLAYASAGVGQWMVAGATFWAADQLIPWQLPIGNPLTWVGYLVLDDFIGYWSHRANHRFRFLWSAHLVHHSAQDMTMANATRLSPAEGFYQPITNVWAPLLGFPVAMYAPLTVVSLLVLECQHTRVIGRLGALDRVFNTPSNHRVHHGRNPQYLDRNFGSWTMVWDHLFGTYAAEVEEPEFGVTDDLDTSRAVRTALGGYPELLADIRRAHSLRPAVARPVLHLRGSGRAASPAAS